MPKETPPTGAVNQLIDAPTAVAFKDVVEPAQITLGVAVTNVGVGHCAFAELIAIAIKLTDSIL